MKKLFYLLFAALAFTSCVKDVDTMSLQEIQKNNFNTEFDLTFGVNASVYANHNWGGDIISLVEVPTMRGFDVNGNLWYQNWERPTNVTEDEIAKVVAEFSKVRVNAVNDIHIDWNNYWVQQVYTGTTHYQDGYGNDILGSSKMNKLIAYSSKEMKTICYWPREDELVDKTSGFYEHVNNFNSGANNTTYTDDETGQQYVGTTLMTDMYAEGIVNQFGYHNSTDSQDHFEYIILEIDGSYYVGFDFYAQHPQGQEANKNMDVERDWIFNDWIVKISPAMLKGSTPTPEVEYVRIMCEDLGAATSDFDYNDVVFDIKFLKQGNTYKADIVLQAAGGTLPLYIGGFEVHELFNAKTTQMVNTKAADGVSRPTVKFSVTLPKSYYATAWDALNDLPVTVSYRTETIQLTTTPGTPAEMIAVPVTTAWSDERVSIQHKYPKFAEWIKDSSVKWWE